MSIPVAEGRVVQIDDVGDPRGDAVVYLHGAPDCRLARHPDDGLAAVAGVRLLAMDRPGYGRSDPPAGNASALATTAADIAAVLDALGIDRCRIVAWSAGTLAALAAAGVLGPERVVAVTSFGAIPPFEACADPSVAASTPARRAFVDPLLAGEVSAAELADELAVAIVPFTPLDDDFALALVTDSLGNRSRAELESVPGALRMMARSLAAAVEVHGTAGLRLDMMSQLTPGQLGAVLGAPCPVRLVHGALDPMAGPAVGEWYRARLPDASVEVWEGASHHALFPRWEELLT